MQNKQGSRIYYDIIEKVNQLNVNDKWVAEVGDISDNDLRLFNASISKFKEVKLQDFQFKINNKSLLQTTFCGKLVKLITASVHIVKNIQKKLSHIFNLCEDSGVLEILKNLVI